MIGLVSIATTIKYPLRSGHTAGGVVEGTSIVVLVAVGVVTVEVVVVVVVVLEVVVEVVVVVTVVGDIVDVVVLGKTENITIDDYLKKFPCGCREK